MGNLEQDLPGLIIIDFIAIILIIFIIIFSTVALSIPLPRPDISITSILPFIAFGATSILDGFSLRELRAMHGAESVVLSDIVRPDDELLQKGRRW